MKICNIAALSILFATNEVAAVNPATAEEFAQSYETIFVVELARHGARTHEFWSPIEPGYFEASRGEKVGPGWLTELGRIQHLRNGLARRQEYVKAKKLLSEEFNPDEIISMSTFKQRCAVSGKHMMYGLYPMQDVSFKKDVNHQRHSSSPLTGTSYQTILDNLQKGDQCHIGPVLQVPHNLDIMMHTRNCPRVHKYLSKNGFDMVRLQQMVRDQFGDASYEKNQEFLEGYFKKEAVNVKAYFEMLDARVAELKQVGGGEEMIQMQRQECFILANNFIGPNPQYGDTYLSKMIVPLYDVIMAKLQEHSNKDIRSAIGLSQSSLKYLIFNLHDTNVSNFLRFLGYWSKYGYQRHVKFGSSVRLELVKDIFQGYKNEIDSYKIRVVYDDAEIHLPFCKEILCTAAEFSEHVRTNLEADLEIADQFCKSVQADKIVTRGVFD